MPSAGHVTFSITTTRLAIMAKRRTPMTVVLLISDLPCSTTQVAVPDRQVADYLIETAHHPIFGFSLAMNTFHPRPSSVPGPTCSLSRRMVQAWPDAGHLSPTLLTLDNLDAGPTPHSTIQSLPPFENDTSKPPTSRPAHFLSFRNYLSLLLSPLQ